MENHFSGANSQRDIEDLDFPDTNPYWKFSDKHFPELVILI